MQKVKSAKHIKFGTVGDSPHTQKNKNNNQRVIENIRMNREGPFWFLKQLLSFIRTRNR